MTKPDGETLDMPDYSHRKNYQLGTTNLCIIVCENLECACENCTCDPCTCTDKNPCGCDGRRPSLWRRLLNKMRI